MLNFSKGFNNQNNTNINNYGKLGRKTPQEIKQDMIKNRYNDLNKQKEQIKGVEQKNSGSQVYDNFNAYRNLNK